MDRGQAVSHYIDRQAHLLTSGPLQLQHGEPITRCCSFWHIMFFRNQIIAPLLFNSAPLHYFFLPSVHVSAEKHRRSYPVKKKLRKGGRFNFFFFSGHKSMSLSRLTSRELRENQHDANWLVSCSLFYRGHFSEVRGFSGVDSLRQECVSFQTLGKKFSHVKTATNYGGSVKALMKGGDLLIESCGCTLFLKIKQHVLCTHTPHDTQALATQAALLASHPLRGMNIVFGRCKYEMLSHGKPWFESKKTLLIFLFFSEKLEILWI